MKKKHQSGRRKVGHPKGSGSATKSKPKPGMHDAISHHSQTSTTGKPPGVVRMSLRAMRRFAVYVIVAMIAASAGEVGGQIASQVLKSVRGVEASQTNRSEQDVTCPARDPSPGTVRSPAVPTTPRSEFLSKVQKIGK